MLINTYYFSSMIKTSPKLLLTFTIVVFLFCFLSAGVQGSGVREDDEARRAILGVGIGWDGNGDTDFNPWLNFDCPMTQSYNLKLAYHTASFYSAGLSYYLDPSTSLDVVAGKGIGPHDKDGIIFGLTNATKPGDFLELYGKYYPVSYLFDSNDWTWEGVWEAGSRLGSRKFGLTVSAYGNPEYEGCRYLVDFSPSWLTWILGYSTLDREPDYSVGIRLNF